MKPVGAMQDAMMQVALLKMLHCSKTLNQGMYGQQEQCKCKNGKTEFALR